jgi:hypothetical protein
MKMHPSNEMLKKPGFCPFCGEELYYREGRHKELDDVITESAYCADCDAEFALYYSLRSVTILKEPT